jgi:hypothetical protein
MKKELSVAPPNSLIVVMDRTRPEIPATMAGKPIASTSSCVAVSTLSELDGATRVILTDEHCAEYLGEKVRSVFRGTLETPSRTLSICTILDQVLLEITTLSTLTNIEILSNKEREPTLIVVAVGK